MQNCIACRVIQDLEELKAAAPAWRALWLADPHAKPFQSPEWLLPWARQFVTSDLRTVMIYDRGALVAVLPFYRYLEPQSREHQLLFLGAGTSDYLDGTYSTDCTAEHIQAGIGQLCRGDDWDALCAFQLTDRSKMRNALESLPLPGLQQIPAESCFRIPAVPLANLPRSIRDQAKYYRRYAMRQGRLELAVADESNWPKAFEVLERLHTSRWQKSGQQGLLADPRVIAWHREALPLLARGGLLRLFTLSLDGNAVAALYSLVDPPGRAQRSQYLYLSAFSVQYAELRPGTLLTAMAVEHAAQEGLQIVDFLRGEEPYKKLWHPQKTPTYGFVMRNLRRSSSNLEGVHIEDDAA